MPSKTKFTPKNGGIQIRADTAYGKRKVGEVIGQVYQKVLRESGVLRNPPSIALSLNEIEQAKKVGAKYLRVVRIDLDETLSISFRDFERHAFSVNRGFGPQLGCPLEHFRYTFDVKDRNAVLDNPRGDPEPSTEFVKPQPQQLDFWQPRWDNPQ
jgi:hypothetical protein